MKEGPCGPDPEANLLSVLPARAPGELYDLGEFPGMRQARDPAARVHGELVTLRNVEGALRRMDAIEEFAGYGSRGSVYRRALIRAEADGNPGVLAWTYLLDRAPAGPLIESGRWRDRPRSPQEIAAESGSGRGPSYEKQRTPPAGVANRSREGPR